MQGARVIERIEGCYVAQEEPFGVSYKWSPECFVIECECCGTRTTLTASRAVCSGCGVDHADIVRREMNYFSQGKVGEARLHPWRYAGDREGVGLPC